MHDIILIGINHKTAPVELRECIAFSEDESASALQTLSRKPHIKELLLFSTCNRVEVLVATKRCAMYSESLPAWIPWWLESPRFSDR